MSFGRIASHRIPSHRVHICRALEWFGWVYTAGTTTGSYRFGLQVEKNFICLCVSARRQALVPQESHGG